MATTKEAAQRAKQTKHPVRDNLGQCHCPCGSVTGRNLNDKMPPLVMCNNCQTANLIKTYGE